MDEYRRSRRETLQEAVESADHSSRLKEQKYAEDTDNISRAYDLAKADEEMRRQRIEMASSLLKLLMVQDKIMYFDYIYGLRQIYS